MSITDVSDMDLIGILCNTAKMPEQPTLARRSLGAAFRRLREDAGQSPREVGEAIGVSRQTIGRIEDGKQATHILQAKALCDHFSVSATAKSHLCELAVRGKEKGWWEPYVEAGSAEPARPNFPLFLETEQVAIHIRVLETEVIPGLLQTPEYLRELQAAQLPQPPEVAEAVRALRTHRQKLMADRTDTPRTEFLISRSVVDYLDALPRDVAIGQRARLLEAAIVPGVEIRVITRLHAGAAGAFAILTPPEDVPPFVYIDDLDGCRYVEDLDIVSVYEQAFAATRNTSISVEEYLT
ncbi:helix-turn-helix domain-containing protein [Glycomyces halotolerans]